MERFPRHYAFELEALRGEALETALAQRVPSRLRAYVRYLVETYLPQQRQIAAMASQRQQKRVGDLAARVDSLRQRSRARGRRA